jgi:tetratricopeptide (TPR) repeat protein
MQRNDLIEQLEAAFEKRRMGDYSGALREFEDLEQKSVHPKDIAPLRLFQTMCLTDLGRIDEAHTRLGQVDKKVLGIIDQIDYESEYARIKRAEGMTDEALERVTHAIKIAEAVKDKHRVEAAMRNMQTLHGILLAEAERCEEAIPVLETVPEEDESWAESRLLLGDCNYRTRRYHEAIDYYLSVTSSGNKVSDVIRNDALRNTGCAYHQLKDYARAVEYLSKVKNAYDEYPAMKAELFGFLASAYTHLGMPQEAAKYSGFSKCSDSIQ